MGQLSQGTMTLTWCCTQEVSKSVRWQLPCTINNLHLSYFEKGPKLHGHLSSQEVSGPSYL